MACTIGGAQAVAPLGPGLPRPSQCPLTAQTRGEAGGGEWVEDPDPQRKAARCHLRALWPERLGLPPGRGLPSWLVGAP